MCAAEVTTHGALPRLLILGAGWASYAVLKNVKPHAYRVIVVSPRNHFLFTPLLASTTVGTLEFRSIIEPIRNYGFEHAKDLHLGDATAVDFSRRLVHCQSALDKDIPPYTLKYDRLVIGVGALSSTFGVPGVEEHCFPLKEIVDARAIRARLLDNFEKSLEPSISDQERKRLKHVVIVGGGPTGVEFGAELYDFCKRDLARLYKDFGSPVKVTLIESQKILSGFDQRLRTYAERKLAQRPNFTMLKAQVTEVRKDSVVLNDGSVLPCGLVVWSTGLAPRPMVQSLDVEKNKQGQIVVDKWLRVRSDPSGNAFAIGDCSSIDGVPLPRTAQVAERQGRYLADCLNRLAADPNLREPPPFQYKSMGMLAYIGGYQGLSDLPEFKLKGFPSWLLWRSAYLTRLGSWRLRLQVPFDWMKTLIFGRDTSRF